MKYPVDMHTHTIVSGHAYTTLFENLEFAKEKGIKILGTSEHGPEMPGGPHFWYFGNIKRIPREYKGIIILRGCEGNIMNTSGEMDVKGTRAENLDYMIASLHEPCFKPSSKEENTNALINALKNPDVFILGHIGNPNYETDYKAVVKAAKEEDKIIEINNSSFTGSREGSKKNCFYIAELCKEYGTKIIFGSDAHISLDVGEFSIAEEMLKEINFPEELIMNDKNKIIEYLKGKGKLQDL